MASPFSTNLYDRIGESTDKRLGIRVFGVVSSEELAAVDDGLQLFLELGN